MWHKRFKEIKTTEMKTKNNDMKNLNTVNGLTNYFNQEGTQIIQNEVGRYQFVKRADGVMLGYVCGEYTFYKTINGLAKAALYKIKRG